MGVVPRRPVPPPRPPGNVVYKEGFGGVLATQKKRLRRRWRVHSWNPGAVVGRLTAWLFTGGRYGRLPLYRDDPVEDIRWEWEKAQGGLLNAGRTMVVGERGPEVVAGYQGPVSSKPPTSMQVPRPKPPPPPAPPLRKSH